jgi:2,4-diaminopentanoate dehydrogenase
MMSERIRVVVWGTGGVGKAVLKLAMRRPDVEVVGALVFSPAKAGLDIGELAGVAEYGVHATTELEDVLALRPDCILHCPMDFGDFRSDAELTDLLRRGFNVITSMPYHNTDVRDGNVSTALDNAAREGGATFYATGINPGFIAERLAATASGAVSEMSTITVEEFVRIGTEPEETLHAFGFGLPPAGVGEKTPAVRIAEQYEKQFIYFLGDAFGAPVKELRYTSDWTLAGRDMEAPTMAVKEGTVAYVTHQWEGVTADGPSINFHTHWYLFDEFKPDGVLCEDYYRISIEGRPSIRLSVEFRASLDPDERLYEGDQTVPVFYVTAATMVNALPMVIAEAPGLQRIALPVDGHFRADLRA